MEWGTINTSTIKYNKVFFLSMILSSSYIVDNTMTTKDLYGC